MTLESRTEKRTIVTEPINFELGNYRFTNFETPGRMLIIEDLRFNCGKKSLPVTGKSFQTYENKRLMPDGWGARLMTGKDDIQLISIAAGLDQTLSYTKIAPRPPIIIDPIEPIEIIAGLNIALLDYNMSREDRFWARLRIQRAQVYLSDKVIHYKMTLQQAMKNHWSGLTGKADIVMDLFGAWFYDVWQGQTTVNNDDIKAAYRQLLKPDGLGEIWTSSRDHG